MRTLYETLLDRNYEVDLRPLELAYTISKLPKCQLIVNGQYCWPDSDKMFAKSGDAIHKLFKGADGIEYEPGCMVDFLDRSGVTFIYESNRSKGKHLSGRFAAWNAGTNTYVYSGEVMILPTKYNEEKLQRRGFVPQRSGYFNAFGIIYKQVNKLSTTHPVHYLTDEHPSYFGGIFYPCQVDIEAVKKALDTNTSDALIL